MFHAITRNASYPAGRQRFTCHCPDAQFPPDRYPPHVRPAVGGGSTCGWYAMKDKRDCLHAYRSPPVRSPQQMNAWLLEVDLWGTVVEGERGYRGEYQRVLSVRPAGQPEVAIAEPNQLYLLGTQILYQPVYRGLFAAPMEPVLRVADLAGQLGTEVLWKDRAGGR
jgi:hypothetical protein